MVGDLRRCERVQEGMTRCKAYRGGITEIDGSYGTEKVLADEHDLERWGVSSRTGAAWARNGHHRRPEGWKVKG